MNGHCWYILGTIQPHFCPKKQQGTQTLYYVESV
jgi:hypothetical protein